jgi:hypothetical protein
LASGHENTWGETSKGDVFGTGPWSWTPGDISGAALSLTNATSIWLRTPHGCTLKVDVTYPTTSDPSGAIVGNVPAICTPAALEGEAAGFSTVGAPVGFFIDATARILIYNSNTGAAYTNAGLSGKRISGVLNIMTIK